MYSHHFWYQLITHCVWRMAYITLHHVQHVKQHVKRPTNLYEEKKKNRNLLSCVNITRSESQKQRKKMRFLIT